MTEVKNMATFIIKSRIWSSVNGGLEIHAQGDVNCPECIYPAAQSCPCGGVMHFYDYDESWDGENEWETHSSICDVCGKSWFDVSDTLPDMIRG